MKVQRLIGGGDKRSTCRTGLLDTVSLKRICGVACDPLRKRIVVLDWKEKDQCGYIVICDLYQPEEVRATMMTIPQLAVFPPGILPICTMYVGVYGHVQVHPTPLKVDHPRVLIGIDALTGSIMVCSTTICWRYRMPFHTSVVEYVPSPTIMQYYRSILPRGVTGGFYLINADRIYEWNGTTRDTVALPYRHPLNVSGDDVVSDKWGNLFSFAFKNMESIIRCTRSTQTWDSFLTPCLLPGRRNWTHVLLSHTDDCTFYLVDAVQGLVAGYSHDCCLVPQLTWRFQGKKEFIRLHLYTMNTNGTDHILFVYTDTIWSLALDRRATTSLLANHRKKQRV